MFSTSRMTSIVRSYPISEDDLNFGARSQNFLRLEISFLYTFGSLCNQQYSLLLERFVQKSLLHRFTEQVFITSGRILEKQWDLLEFCVVDCN